MVILFRKIYKFLGVADMSQAVASSLMGVEGMSQAVAKTPFLGVAGMEERLRRRVAVAAGKI